MNVYSVIAADSDDDFIKPMDTDEEDDEYYQSASALKPPRGNLLTLNLLYFCNGLVCLSFYSLTYF